MRNKIKPQLPHSDTLLEAPSGHLDRLGQVDGAQRRMFGIKRNCWLAGLNQKRKISLNTRYCEPKVKGRETSIEDLISFKWYLIKYLIKLWRLVKNFIET